MLLVTRVAVLWLQVASSTEARALLDSAYLRRWRTPFDTADAWFSRAATAAQAANAPELRAEALLNLAIVRTRSRSTAAALSLVDTAGPLISSDDLTQQTMLQCARAYVLVHMGDPAAEAAAVRGVGLSRRARHEALESECQIVLAWHHMNVGNQERAAATFDSAVKVAQRSGDRRAKAAALWWRGNQQLEVYEHEGARRDLTAALREATADGNLWLQGWAWLRLAIISWHFSDFISARAQLARGRALLDTLGDIWGMGYARYTAAALLLDAGEPDAAERALREDLTWAERAGLPIEAYTARFGLARVAVRRSDWRAAVREFNAADSIVRRAGLQGYRPQLDYEYGVIALRQGDHVSAERRFRAALASQAGVAPLDRYAVRSRLAYIHLARNDIAGAEREITVAARELDSMRASLGDRELRLQAFQSRKGFDDADAGLASVVAGLATAGRAQVALDLVERRRARELRSGLLRLSANALGADHQYTTQPLAAHLPDERTALLEYVTGAGGQPTTLFVITRRGLTTHRIAPADSLASDIASFSELLEAGAGARALAQSIATRVIAPAMAALPSGVSRLVVVPDGVLHRLPFDALTLPNGRPLVADYALSIAPAAAVLSVLWDRAPGRPNGRILAFGDPRFADEQPASGSAAATYRDAFAGNGGLTRLPASAQEARMVARFGTRPLVRLRARASEAALKALARDSFDIMHFATHALVDDRSPARTALALAPGGGDDGFVGPEELLALAANVRLVVLSACRTARGALVAGEGVQGLTAPLLQAGARAVVASQWRVEDQRTVRFVATFYGALAAGHAVGDALREAKLEALRRGEPPSVWAAFTLVGDPLLTLGLTPPAQAPRVTIAWVALGVVVVAYGLWIAKRRGAARSSEPSPSRADTVQ